MECVSTTSLDCQNNGTSNGTVCLCPVQMAGTVCQRYIRDCTEAVERNGASSDDDGDYLIQPVSAPAPFWVACVFRNTGGQYILRRKPSNPEPDFDVSWLRLQTGRDMQMQPGARTTNFFIGLDSLHALTAQSDHYWLQVKIKTHEVPAAYFYRDFSIGNNSTNYKLFYGTHYVRDDNDGTMVHGFPDRETNAFHTRDRDLNGCADARGASGWYGQTCDGHSFFSDNSDDAWPLEEGDPVQWVKADLVVERRYGLLHDDDDDDHLK